MYLLSFLIRYIYIFCLIKINRCADNEMNGIEYLSFDDKKVPEFEVAASNIKKFGLNKTDNFENNYYIHIYILQGELSLYGLKCTKISQCDFNSHNMFNEYKKGNIIFSNKVNRNINLYINSDTTIERDDKYFLIFPVVCHENSENCKFNIGIYNLTENNTVTYNLKENEDFSIRQLGNKNFFSINQNEYKPNSNITIEFTLFYGNNYKYFEVKGNNNNTVEYYFQKISNIYKFSFKEENCTKYNIEIINEDYDDYEEYSKYFKIHYYIIDEQDFLNYYITSCNELYAVTINNNNSQQYYNLNFNHINDNSDHSFFILIYSVNCEIDILQDGHDYSNDGKGVQLFEHEYENGNESLLRIKYSDSNELTSQNMNCMVYVAKIDINLGKYLYLHTNEKIAFQFTETIKEMSFRYVSLMSETKTNNLFLEVTVPPLCEILLNVYVFEGQKYLIISKIIKNKKIFYLSQLSRMCNIGDECLIHSEISNFKCMYSSYTNSEKFYRGSMANNTNFIYIQYLNDMDSPLYYISTNKVIKEFSKPSYNEEFYYYTYQIMNNKEYELFINFDKRPKNVDVYFDEEKIKIEKTGRYLFKSNSSNDDHYINFRVKSHLYLSGFTYYLREKHEELEIIANETIHGYFSEDENILNYIYSFEDKVTSFYLEIFSSNLKIKIQDKSGDNCWGFPKDFQDLKATELKNYTIKDPNLTTLEQRKIRISFKYSGKSEPTRHFRFRLLPIYYKGNNLIYLNEGDEAICNPKFGNKYCYFFFPLPVILIKKDKIAINGYYENSLEAKIPLFGKQISLRKELTLSNFEDLKKNEPRDFNYMEHQITANYSVNNYNYFIGFFETDGSSSIRIVYSITPSGSTFEGEGFDIAPGELKFYSIFGKKGDQYIKPKLGDIQKTSGFQGYLSIIKVNKKFILSATNNTISKKNINIEDVIIMEMWDDFDQRDPESELILSSIRSHLCSFYLKYDIVEKNETIFYLVKDKSHLIYLNNVSYPLHFYLPIIENNKDLIINFKFTEQDYLTSNNQIKIEEYDLSILLVDEYFISQGQYLNITNYNLTGNIIIDDHFIKGLYNIELLNAEQIYLISFNVTNNITIDNLSKYSYLYFCLRPKDEENSKKNNIKIQIMYYRNDNNDYIIPQYKYFYSFLNTKNINNSSYYLRSDKGDNYFIVSISSEQINNLNISFNFEPFIINYEDKNDEVFKGQRLYLFSVGDKNDINHFTVNVGLSSEMNEENLENKKIYYTIKYFSSKALKPKKNKVENIVPKYAVNLKKSKKSALGHDYDNINNVIKTWWSTILNHTDQFSYVESRYILRFFECRIHQSICNSDYSLTIFPYEFKEKTNLLRFTSEESFEEKIKEKQFEYKVVLLAYFEDQMGEEIMFAYGSAFIKHKDKDLMIWIIVIIGVFFIFLVISVTVLFLKIKEERNYFEFEKEKINLKSFSNERIREDDFDDDKLLKLD